MQIRAMAIITMAFLFLPGVSSDKVTVVDAEKNDAETASCALQKSGNLKKKAVLLAEAKVDAGRDLAREEATFFQPDPNTLRWDTKLHNDSQADEWVAKGAVVMYGWLKVPLIHDKKQNSYSVQSVCLRVRGATFQKENPLLFMHCGGPSTGRECTHGVMSDVLKSFNVITITQRGLALLDPNGLDSSPPDCPFSESPGSGMTPVKMFPELACDESRKNFSKVASLLDLAENSAVFQETVKPMIQNGPKGTWFTNETKVRWQYRVAKLEYEMCSARPEYVFNNTSGGKRSAFDLIGTVALAHDIDVFRQALGAESLSCWGVSYGTTVCGTYATVFPERIFRMVLDANTDPRPDVLNWAEFSGAGVMAVFRGIAAACEASILESQDRCPLAPFMAEKLHKIMVGPESKEQRALSALFNKAGFQADVPCSAVMLSCMAWAMQGGVQPASCVGQWAHLATASEMIQKPRPSQDPFGFIPTFAIIAQDVHGRLTEEGIIAWWKDARNRFTFGLDFALATAIGISVWPSIATPSPPVGDSQLQPLIVGNLRDAQTSYIASQRMKQGFPQGHLLTYQGYGHGLNKPDAFTNSNSAAFDSCFEHVSKYLREGKLPEDGQTCAVMTTAKVSERDAVQQASTFYCKLL